jgi:hypothetical protein
MEIRPGQVRHLAKPAAFRGRRFLAKGTLAIWLLVLCLAAAAPAPAQAASNALRWTRVNIPAAGEAGDWVLAPGGDITHLASGADGTLYAAVRGLTESFLRSTDSGYTWSPVGNVAGDIAAVATAPGKPGVVYYATTSAVYMSTNSGRTFQPLAPAPGDAGADGRAISSLAVAGGEGDTVAVAIRDTDGGGTGGVYTLDEADIVPAWTDTGLGAHDAWAVAFSPDYGVDRQLMAVVTDASGTYVTTRTGNAAWNADIGEASLDQDGSGDPTPLAGGVSAAIAFPSDYDHDVSSAVSVFYVAVNTGRGAGDVYKVRGAPAPGGSVATDLNIGGAFGEGDIDIAGLAIGDGDPAVLLAVAADARAFVSVDGGTTWTASRHGPTGSSGGAALAPSRWQGRVYAATGGSESALSVSEDCGASWTQVGLIDTRIDAVVDAAPSPRFEQDGTVFMLTFGNGHSLWRSRGGGSWERVLSGDAAGGDIFSQVALSPQYGDACRNVFVAGESGGRPAIWESKDDGQVFQCRYTKCTAAGPPFSVDAWATTGEEGLVIGSYDGSHGMVYRSPSGGFTYNDGTPAGDLPICSIAVFPSADSTTVILAGNTGGRVYLSEDGGVSFTPLPASGGPAGPVIVAFDPGFAENHTVYAAGNGIYRCVAEEGGEWQDISAAASAYSGLAPGENGTLYASVPAAGGGLVRSLDPWESSGVTFATLDSGLDAGATLQGLRSSGSRVWSIDTTGNTLLTFDDTMTSPVALISPSDGDGGLGTLSNHAIKDVRLDWSTVEGATGYEWQCSYLNDFSDVPAGLSGTTSTSSVRLPGLDPGTTYHWRVRASSPVPGPWSEKWTFTTALDTETVALQPESPTPGAVGVPVQPYFQWTAVSGADAYELLVAPDTGFSRPGVVRTGDTALPTNAWQCDAALEHATTYYWKVRAVTRETQSQWSATGVFTTAPEPSPEATLDHQGLPATSTTTPAGTVAVLNTRQTSLTPPPAASPTSVTPAAEKYYNLPAWSVYLIGALVATVMLALFVILAMALKIRG